MARTQTFQLEELRKQKEEAQRQLEVLQHQLQRLDNRTRYLEKGERSKRTHRLCTRAGALESLAPETRQLTDAEFFELMEQVLCTDSFHAQLTHALAEHDRKEAQLHGTVSFSCDPD